MGVGPGPDPMFESSASPSKGRFKFKLGVGPGVLDFELVVTGRGFTLFFFAEAIGVLHLRTETACGCEKER